MLITVVPTSSPCRDWQRLTEGSEWLGDLLDCDLRFDPLCYEPGRFFSAASPAERAEAVERAFGCSDFVLALRGGSTASELLPLLDFAALAEAHPRLIGFSDVTALHTAIVNAGGEGLHAPMLAQLGESGANRRSLLAALRGKPMAVTGESGAGAKVEGVLVGGNLSLLVSLCGTPWQLRAEGAIILLEEAGSKPYRIQRMLTQLAQAGVLDGAAGFALGSFSDCECDPACPYGDCSSTRVVEEFVGQTGLPWLSGLPVGHGERNETVVLGRRYTLDPPSLLLAP